MCVPHGYANTILQFVIVERVSVQTLRLKLIDCENSASGPSSSSGVSQLQFLWIWLFCRRHSVLNCWSVFLPLSTVSIPMVEEIGKKILVRSPILDYKWNFLLEYYAGFLGEIFSTGCQKGH